MPATPFINMYCNIFSPKFKRGDVWRRDGDLNPSTGISRNTISNRAHSTALPSLLNATNPAKNAAENRSFIYNTKIKVLSNNIDLIVLQKYFSVPPYASSATKQ